MSDTNHLDPEFRPDGEPPITYQEWIRKRAQHL